MLILVIVLIPVVLGITLDELYPFGSQARDTAMEKNDDGSSPNIPIATLFPFFNHQHSTVIVSKVYKRSSLITDNNVVVFNNIICVLYL